MKKAFLAVAILLLLALVGWRFASRLGQGGGGRKPVAPTVSVAAVERRDLEQTFTAVGTVESPQRVEISAKISGRIEWMVAQVGDRVRAGEELVRLDAGDLQEQVDQRRAESAEARYRLAQAELARGPAEASVASDLRQQEAAVATAAADLQQVRQTSAARVGQARAQADNAAAELENARARFERTESLYQQAFTAAQDVDDARTAVRVAEGQARSAGEAMRAAQAQARADVAAAEARLQQARAALDFARANQASNPAYEQNLSALRSIAEAADASLASASTRLTDTTLKSPLSGYVTARHLDPGSLAQAGQPILTVQSTDELWVTVTVPEEVRPQMDARTAAEVEFDSLEGARVEGRILRINAAADPQSRQFEVRVILKPDSRIRPGMFARVTLQLQRAARALAVPRQAVRRNDDGPFVLLLGEDGKIKARPVSLGLTTPGYAQVLDGLQEGDRVVTLGPDSLEDGQQVRADGSEEER